MSMRAIEMLESKVKPCMASIPLMLVPIVQCVYHANLTNTQLSNQIRKRSTFLFKSLVDIFQEREQGRKKT